MTTMAMSLPSPSAAETMALTADRLVWPARIIVGTVIAAGAMVIAANWPAVYPQAGLMVLLLAATMLLSLMKLRLPLINGEATASMAYAVDFAALLLCGADIAMLVACFGALVQCSFNMKGAQPTTRTLYSLATVAISVQSSGAVWAYAGGDLSQLGIVATVAPMIAAATIYFVVNTVLIALAIGVTAGSAPVRIWQDEFLWSAPSYFLSAVAGTLLAMGLSHGTYALLALVMVPLYVSHRAYRISVDRIEAQRRHAAELAAMVGTTQAALARATASEAALQREKERLALERTRMAITLQTITDAVITVDSTGRVLLVNESAGAMARLGAAQPADGPVTELFTAIGIGRAVYTDAIERVLQSGEAVQLRCDVDSPRHKVLEVTGSPMRNGDNRVAGAVWVLRDVTDATQMEHERSKAARLESLGVLAGGLAHDFNNILMGVVGNLSLARTLVGNDHRRLIQRLYEAEAACVRARGVTGQLLTFAKGGAPVKTAASIEELVTESARFALSGSPVAGKFNIDPDLWSAEVDTIQISQVVHNLVLNAVQAMPQGGTVEIGLSNVRLDDGMAGQAALASGLYVRVSVSDSGKGIAAEHLPHIFEPYFTTKQKGSGLGLAITASIVRAHGGTIAVESSAATGTRFDVYVPASTARVVAAVAPREEAAGGHVGRVLLMDDDAAVSEVAEGMLDVLGYTTATAPCGQSALERLAAAEAAGQPFDLVILDLTVPGGMGGKETVPHVRALRPDIPILVTSGYADNTVLAEYAKYGFDGVLPKPFTIPDLRVAIEEVGIRRRGHDATPRPEVGRRVPVLKVN
jgi:PAS domain S-box-containing protein